MKEIKVKEVKFEVKDSGGIEIFYQPETVQVLHPGKLYKFVFDPPPGKLFLKNEHPDRPDPG